MQVLKAEDSEERARGETFTVAKLGHGRSGPPAGRVQ